MAYKDLSRMLFLDIETVSQKASFSELSERMQALWNKKADMIRKSGEEELTPADLYGRAGIYSEFGKIVCISVGFIKDDKLRIKSFYGHDEAKLLNEFADLLNNHYNGIGCALCAHNGKEFDFPYIARRMVINGIELPKILDVAGRKPWETSFIDTMELWKFGDYKNYTSLELLCAILDIPTPKDDINGSQVGEVYWKENDVERIKTYCQKDVISVAQIMRRYAYQPLLTDENIEYISR